MTIGKKDNPDYSKSAFMLTNPPQIAELLVKYHKEESDMMILQDEIKKCIPPELLDRVAILAKWHAETNQTIHDSIDQLGSYQDVAKGEYAIKQKRESISYQPALVRQYLPVQYHPVLMVESVNTKALEGLVKGGFVTPEQARSCGEVKETFAYIIK